MMHKECMQHLKLHREEFMEWHRKKLKDRKKLANQVKSNLETRKKEKEELEEKRKIARLKELKAQNMEIYLELVEEEKKTKIRELLGQTNKFLKELGAKVLVQKEANQEAQEEVTEKEEENLKDIFQSSNTVYYNLTHTIKEEIKEQPNIL
jgi:ATP-dependent helicase STH1/SNF2